MAIYQLQSPNGEHKPKLFPTFKFGGSVNMGPCFGIDALERFIHPFCNFYFCPPFAPPSLYTEVLINLHPLQVSETNEKQRAWS